MESSNTDDMLRHIEEEIAAARLQMEPFFDKVSELGNAIRDIEIRAADQIRAIEAESDLHYKKLIEFEDRINDLETEASVLKSR
jgi:hypothetical protein